MYICMYMIFLHGSECEVGANCYVNSIHVTCTCVAYMQHVARQPTDLSVLDTV